MVGVPLDIFNARSNCVTNALKIADISATYAKVQPLAKKFVRNLPLISKTQIEYEDKNLPNLLDILHAEFSSAI